MSIVELVDEISILQKAYWIVAGISRFSPSFDNIYPVMLQLDRDSLERLHSRHIRFLKDLVSRMV
jgi:hypothetical protein